MDKPLDDSTKSMAEDFVVYCSSDEVMFSYRRWYDDLNASGNILKAEPSSIPIPAGRELDAVKHSVCGSMWIARPSTADGTQTDVPPAGATEQVATAAPRKDAAEFPRAVPTATTRPSPRSSTSGSLAAGASWVYRFSDRTFADHSASVTVKVLQANDQVIEEQVSATMGMIRATAVRRQVDARAASFDRYPLGASDEALTEFAPYLFAAGGERAVRNVTATGYPRDGDQSWAIKTAPPVWDQITVPAGTFRAMRLEIKGRRRASYPSTVRFVVRVWYAPEVNRYVKLENETWDYFEHVVTNEVVELVRSNPPS